jgi:hypothetical protein
VPSQAADASIKARHAGRVGPACQTSDFPSRYRPGGRCRESNTAPLVSQIAIKRSALEPLDLPSRPSRFASDPPFSVPIQGVPPILVETPDLAAVRAGIVVLSKTANSTPSTVPGRQREPADTRPRLRHRRTALEGGRAVSVNRERASASAPGLTARRARQPAGGKTRLRFGIRFVPAARHIKSAACRGAEPIVY